MTTEIRGSTIFHESIGEGTPVVALHGYAADHRLAKGWLEPVFAGVPGYRRLYPDLPGMGQSVPAPGLTNADAMAETLMDWVDAVLGVSLATLCNFANNLALSPVNPELQAFLPAQLQAEAGHAA